MANFEFGPFSKFKPEKPKPKHNYKYPYMDILESGQKHGFFVWGLKKKLTIPKTIKNTTHRILSAVHPETGESGYYMSTFTSFTMESKNVVRKKRVCGKKPNKKIRGSSPHFLCLVLIYTYGCLRGPHNQISLIKEKYKWN